MKPANLIFSAFAAALLFSACSNNNTSSRLQTSSGTQTISPSNATAVSDAISLKVNNTLATKLTGSPPQATVGDSSITISTPQSDVVIKNGQTISQTLSIDSSNALSSLFVKIVGASNYYSVDLRSSAKSIRNLVVSVGMPSNITSGTSCIDYSVETEASEVSQPTTQCFDIESDITAPTPSASANATNSPSASPAASSSPSPAPSATVSPIPVASASPSPSPSATASPQASATPSPSPSASSTPDPGETGHATACFNAELLTPGTSFTQTYKTFTDGAETSEFTDERSVFTGSFEGQTATETSGTTTTTTTQGQSSSDTQTYTQEDFNAPHIKNLGSVTTASSTTFGVTTTTENKNVFDPPRLILFDFYIGESYTQTYDVMSTTTVTSSAGGGPTTQETEITQEVTRTYVRDDEITVPAGTFQVCNFQDFVATTIDGQRSDSVVDFFFDKQTGLLILQESDTTRTELQSATVNGVSVK